MLIDIIHIKQCQVMQDCQKFMCRGVPYIFIFEHRHMSQSYAFLKMVVRLHFHLQICTLILVCFNEYIPHDTLVQSSVGPSKRDAS